MSKGHGIHLSVAMTTSSTFDRSFGLMPTCPSCAASSANDHDLFSHVVHYPHVPPELRLPIIMNYIGARP